MAAPLKTTKQTVNLAAPGVRGSRIRRHAPPPEKPKKELTAQEIIDREKRMALIGIGGFALAITIIFFALMSYWGFSLGDYAINLN